MILISEAPEDQEHEDDDWNYSVPTDNSSDTG